MLRCHSPIHNKFPNEQEARGKGVLLLDISLHLELEFKIRDLLICCVSRQNDDIDVVLPQILKCTPSRVRIDKYALVGNDAGMLLAVTL